MPDQTYNPIKSVVSTAAGAIPVTVPCPSSYEYKLSDVSASDAGRTEDALMHKMMIAQKVHLELAWQNVSTAVASQILNAFNHEYLRVQYLDVMANAYLTKTFYVGDRSVPSYNVKLGIWSNVAFNLIEQ